MFAVTAVAAVADKSLVELQKENCSVKAVLSQSCPKRDGALFSRDEAQKAKDYFGLRASVKNVCTPELML